MELEAPLAARRVTAHPAFTTWRARPTAKAPATRHVLARAALAQTELGLGSPEAAAARAAEASAIATRFALPGKPSYWVGYGLLVQAEVDEARGRAASHRELGARSLLQLAPTVGTEHALARRAAAMAGR